MTRRLPESARVLLCIIACCIVWPSIVVSAARSTICERDGSFLLFQGPSQSPITPVATHRIIYTEKPTIHYETEVLMPDGSWHVVDSDNGDRLLEIQTLDPKRNYQLVTTQPLYSQPSDHPSYSLNIKAEPNLYRVSRKAYDYVELTLLDGSTGWIRLAENKTSIEYEQPGFFTGQLVSLDHRIAGGLVVKTEISPPACRVQTEMIPEYVTVHNASNFEDKATAAWHAYQFSILTFMPGVTYHYVVDDKEAFQLTPLNEVTYNAGDRFLHGNGASVAIEICDYADGRNYPAAEVNGAKLAAAVLYQLGLPKENLRFHRDWNGKACPLSMIEGSRGSVGLDAFVDMVNAEYQALVLSYGSTYAPLTVTENWHNTDTRDRSTGKTVLREKIIRETDAVGAKVTRVVMETVDVPDVADYGVLPYVAGGLFALTVAGGIFYSIHRNKKQSLPFDP